jgi:hypothetical protein
LRVCRSHSKAENKNCYRNQLFHLRPFSGAPPPGTPRQARNISSYTKTTQQRENGPSVPRVPTKFRRDFTRTRESLLLRIGCWAFTLRHLACPVRTCRQAELRLREVRGDF